MTRENNSQKRYAFLLVVKSSHTLAFPVSFLKRFLGRCVCNRCNIELLFCTRKMLVNETPSRRKLSYILSSNIRRSWIILTGSRYRKSYSLRNSNPSLCSLYVTWKHSTCLPAFGNLKPRLTCCRCFSKHSMSVAVEPGFLKRLAHCCLRHVDPIATGTENYYAVETPNKLISVRIMLTPFQSLD